MRVHLISNLEGAADCPTAYVRSLCDGLAGLGVEVSLGAPGPSAGGMLAWPGLRQLGGYLRRTPLPSADVYHLTSQALASALMVQRFGRPVVVTAGDLRLPRFRRDSAFDDGRRPGEQALDRLTLAGLQRADAVIAPSHYTRQVLIDTLRIPAERVHVVPPAVDSQRFRPQPVPDAFLERYDLKPEGRFVLLVDGGEATPNLQALAGAFGQIQHRVPGAKLIAVSPAGRATRGGGLAQRAEIEPGAGSAWYAEVPDDDLPHFYNLAEVAVLPYIGDGSGQAALQAMSCGKAVVYARDGALSELVGQAGLAVSGRDEAGMAGAIARLLEDQTERLCRGRLGQRRASTFGPSRQARQTFDVYRQAAAPAVQAASLPAGSSEPAGPIP